MYTFHTCSLRFQEFFQGQLHFCACLFIFVVVVVVFLMRSLVFFFSLIIHRKFFHFLHLDRVRISQLSRKSSDPSTLLILFQLLGETQSVRAHAGVVCSIIHHAAGKKKKLSSICHFPLGRGGSSAQSLRSQIRTVAILLL